MIAHNSKLAELVSRGLSALKLPMVAIAWMFASACFTTSQAKPIVPGSSPFLDDTADKTVMFVSRGASSAFCGGVYVTENAVLTAYHCVDEGQWCTNDMGITLTSCGTPDAGNEVRNDATKHAFLFYTYDDHKSGATCTSEPWIAVLVKHDERADLALLYTRHASAAYATIAGMLPETGSIAYVIGHPEWVSYTHLSAHVNSASTRTMRNKKGTFSRHVVVLDKRIREGTSGGGLWNAGGELIGICLSRSTIFNESYFASVVEIDTFLLQ